VIEVATRGVDEVEIADALLQVAPDVVDIHDDL
jgi:hypothetical protein